MKLTNFLLEDNDTYEFGCVMLYFDFPEIKQIHEMIKQDDVFTDEGDRSFGLEDEPHTTLLYGLHREVTDQDIKDVLTNFTFGYCKVFNASLFENKDYDVLKFDVEGQALHSANRLLKEFPHTSTFPTYHPHMTIGYLKSGEGEKYVEKFKGLQFKLLPQYAIYSKPNGEQIRIEINID